ncbi:MAG TPA: pitrilysin family protein, partial [Candidatus Kapabacteria bacterium]|nr:pitrilysin family protein [Candidatus Kapabacteria bacterium]
MNDRNSMTASGSMQPAPTLSNAIPFVEYDLDNGMHVILSRSQRVPLVVTNLWYRVGSKDDPPSRTGFAHLFEHMMFQGSKHIGKAAHFSFIQRAGGSLNATTNVDRTNYFETLPMTELELALWLESDRMLALDVTKENFENQRAVVKEERRQRYENRPYGRVWETIIPHLFPTSGYHWTTIGSMQHLDEATIDDARAFHAEFYKPNNCSLLLAGQFEEANARALIERYFGNIPRGTDIARRDQTIAPVGGAIRLTMHDAVKLPAVHLTFQACKAFEREEYILDLLSDVLGTGRSSRLYQELVYRRAIAKDAHAFNDSNEKAGEFSLSATVQLGHSPEEVEDALWSELQKIQEHGIDERELEKVKNRAE